MIGTLSFPLQPSKSPTAQATSRVPNIDRFMALFSSHGFVPVAEIPFLNPDLPAVCSPLRGDVRFGFVSEGKSAC